MGEAYKCDRCGEFGDGNAPNSVIIKNSKDGIPSLGDKYLKNRQLSLCPECSREVKRLLNFPEVSLETDSGEIVVRKDD